MHQTQQELMKRQGNKLEKSYIELTPGTPVWVQHRQNATWEPAIVVNQCAPNLYWIMQENGTEQPKVYRQTRSMLKIRSTPTRVAMLRFRLNSLCFPCVHDQFPCVFQYIYIKYYFYKWPPLPFTAILSSLLFNNNIKSSAFDYKNTLPC